MKINVDKQLLTDYESNPIYKRYGVRAQGKQSLTTGEIDKSNLWLIEIIHYSPSYKEDYLTGLINKAHESWVGIKDADDWLSDLRGDYGG